MNAKALELKKLGRMKITYQRKLRELARAPSNTPQGRIEHLQKQVSELETRINNAR
jgi:hypothetical protein